MVVYPKQIERHLQEELPFMATEKILMACVERGKSRQLMHEVIREHSVAAAHEVKNNGAKNDLLERLGADERVPFVAAELTSLLANYQSFTGRAKEQTLDFLREEVKPILQHYASYLNKASVELHV